MNGPYPINEIDKIVKIKSPGAFILSRHEENAHLVGRSETDLNSSIKSAIEKNKTYKFFFYEYTDSPKDAFYLECRWYHDYIPPDNETHPKPLPGANWRCPIKGCPWS